LGADSGARIILTEDVETDVHGADTDGGDIRL
jgi:hypothetical protein